jgi:flavorubredoxin
LTDFNFQYTVVFIHRQKRGRTMIDVTEIAAGIHRVSLINEQDMVQAGILWPDVSYNMFVFSGATSAILETMYRRSFARLRGRIGELVDVSRLGYVVVPHHEGDSSGALNEWLGAAPKATVLCSELCAALNLRDYGDREPRVVQDGEVVDLGAHRLRFILTPHINQWDSLMVYEENTRTLFPNDLFSHPGVGVTTRDDPSEAALGAARHLGYQPNDRASLLRALDKIAALPVDIIANMHGPTVYGHFDRLVATFRDHDL